ncbi:MAG: MgtC/SapB family protein [Firmicutes bacterium]|nr:MgtC/SapB family protein [Bacillota bacterium]MBR5926762.1 MgtC/SapB family protein [Bacillota bacterium]MBR6025690.1 MgtC/SapB family protein [Bacillota bacterium]
MNFGVNDWFNGGLNPVLTAVFCVRIAVACFCGALIGIERSRNFKEAGIRTHIIVCCGAALAMIVSKYGFIDLEGAVNVFFPGTRGADPSRIASQVISGISFIGAGVIFRREGLVRGLTTAAGIWVTAAIGLAVGSGMVFIGLFSTILILAMQTLMHRFTFGADSYSTSALHFRVKNGYKFNQTLQEQLNKWGATVLESSYDRSEEHGTTTYDLSVRRKTPITYAELRDFAEEHPEIIASRNSNAQK